MVKNGQKWSTRGKPTEDPAQNLRKLWSFLVKMTKNDQLGVKLTGTGPARGRVRPLPLANLVQVWAKAQAKKFLVTFKILKILEMVNRR